MTVALRRSFASLSVPNYRRYFTRPGHLDQRQLDADRRGDVAGRAADRQRRLRRPDRRAAVPARAAVRRLGRRPRRPHAEAPAADVHAGRDGRAGPDPVGPHDRRLGRAVDGLRARAGARRRHRHRQPGAAELRLGDRRQRPRGQRGRAELPARPHGADRRPRGGRRRDRAAGRGPLLPGQRAVVRRDAGRAAHDGPEPAAARPDRRARPRAAALRARLRARDTRPVDPAGDDGRDRDVRLQLPGPAPAAGRLHVERDRHDLRAAHQRDGRSAPSPARSRRARAAASGRRCWSARRRRSGPSSSWPPRPRPCRCRSRR